MDVFFVFKEIVENFPNFTAWSSNVAHALLQHKQEGKLLSCLPSGTANNGRPSRKMERIIVQRGRSEAFAVIPL
jgi:hypothetical protein